MCLIENLPFHHIKCKELVLWILKSETPPLRSFPSHGFIDTTPHFFFWQKIIRTEVEIQCFCWAHHPWWLWKKISALSFSPWDWLHAILSCRSNVHFRYRNKSSDISKRLILHTPSFSYFLCVFVPPGSLLLFYRFLSYHTFCSFLKSYFGCSPSVFPCFCYSSLQRNSTWVGR